MQKWTEEQTKYQKFLATPEENRFEKFGTDKKTVFIQEVLSVTRQTASSWTKIPGWIEQVNQYAVHSQQHRLGTLYKAIFDKAIEEKDPRAQKLAAEIGINMLNKVTIINEDSDKATEDMTAEDLMKKLKETMQEAMKENN